MRRNWGPRARPLSAALALCVATIYGCSDSREVAAPEMPVAGSRVAYATAAQMYPFGLPHEHRATIDETFAGIDSLTPGFGGLYVNADRAVVVWATPGTNRGLLEATIRTRLRSLPWNRVTRIEWKEARFSVNELQAWRVKLPALFSGQVLMMDLDEKQNHLWIGVMRSADISALRRSASSAGIPDGMLVIEHVDPPKLLRGDIRDTVRPLVGGAKIDVHPYGSADPQHTCTIGFNVRLPNDNNEYFVTNSHCTTSYWANDSDQVYQPYRNYQGQFYQTPIGIEVYDPAPSSLPGCPVGYLCRYSDAALFRYINNAPVSFAGIAKTAFFGYDPQTDGSFNQVATFTNIADVPASTWNPIDLYLVPAHKVGSRTGWTFGYWSRSCYQLLAGGIWLLCQQDADTWTDEGDSGAPVFWWMCCGVNQTWLAGIVNSAIPQISRMGFSTIDGVKNDLGPLITY